MAKLLPRRLSFWDAVATGIAAMVGAGIFVVSGIGAGIAGPAVIIAFLIAGVVALFNALSSAELAAAIPREGGAYEYGRRLLSPKIGFITGWLFISSKMLESATVALAFGESAALLLPADSRLFAALAVVAMSALNVAGIRASTNASKLMVVVKIGVLAVFAVLGAGAIKPASYAPFAPFGFEGVLAAAAIVFFAYTGYARIATLGEEIKEPRKTIPRAIIVLLGITAAIYILVTAVAVGLLGAKQFSESASPIAAASATLGIPWLVLLVIFGAAVATLNVLLGDLLASSRTAFAMARNRDLPEFLSRTRTSNPENSIFVTSAIVLALTLVGNLVQVASLTSLTILLYYSVTNASALRLSRKKRLYPRLISVAGFVCCIGLALFLPLDQWIWTIGLVAAAFAYKLLNKMLGNFQAKNNAVRR